MRTVRFLTVAAFSLLPVSACNSTPADDGGTGGGAGASASGGQTTGGIGGDDGSGGRATGGNGTGGKGVGGGSGGIPETCGDAHVDDGEECDDGEETAACNANCTEATCGDGIRNAATGEECDDGEESEDCNADCTLTLCGDEIVNAAAGEECDDGEETADCNANCTNAECGDGIRNQAAGEDCDDAGDSEDCNADCTPVACGDNYVNEAAGEECEGELFTEHYPGQPLTENYCVECKKNVCGDEIAMKITLAGSYACGLHDVCPDVPPEDCDSGGVDTATCDYDCTNRACGDDHVNEAAGEQCDDGNTTSGDGCSYAGCQIE